MALPENLLDKQSVDVLIAIAMLAAGLVAAKLSGAALKRINSERKIFSHEIFGSMSKITSLLVFLIFALAALGIMQGAFGKSLLSSILPALPEVTVVIVFFLLGYILINVAVEVLRGIFSRVVEQDYLQEFGLSDNATKLGFNLVKFFLYLVLFSAVLNYYAKPIPFFDSLIVGAVFTLIFIAGALVAYSFKDYVANALLARYVERNILKPGQRVIVGKTEGTVKSISSHGAAIDTPSGYTLIVPNKSLVTSNVQVARSGSISRLEPLIRNFKPQLPSHCGPASLSMLLGFLGYNTVQEQVALESKTKVPGGTEPEDLIAAAGRLTRSEVKGHLVRFGEINDLAEEAKSWVAEGALLVLWYKKPVLFPQKKSRSGHYVLCVGIEGKELIVLDPSNETGGIYLVDANVLKEAMDEHDIRRGYIVFAKKGTRAFWRLTEGLIYTDASSYKNLSKSFERYLKGQFRQGALVEGVISEHVLSKLGEEKVKYVWKPDLTMPKARQKQEEAGAKKEHGQ
ncbi:MAG: C39 family peptidase [Candidatus Diapherotrites archaeon]|uniref:C39 family peptidase n=1 Tax=Candidatus Iainarchaeum sp. TaxID=3101447 RepID=A0A8T3YNR6_9ARCH|nr:C39 family peptidase [Candidatus Diapherotrites archaeon]